MMISAGVWESFSPTKAMLGFCLPKRVVFRMVSVPGMKMPRVDIPRNFSIMCRLVSTLVTLLCGIDFKVFLTIPQEMTQRRFVM